MIQKIGGTLSYYGIYIYNTILPVLSDIAAEKSSATKNIAIKVAKLLKYLATTTSTTIKYSSGMVLFVHTDTSYYQ